MDVCREEPKVGGLVDSTYPQALFLDEESLACELSQSIAQSVFIHLQIGSTQWPKYPTLPTESENRTKHYTTVSESVDDMPEVCIASNLKQCKTVSQLDYPVTNGPLRVDKIISPASELVTVFNDRTPGSAEEPARAVSRVSEINIPDACGIWDGQACTFHACPPSPKRNNRRK